MNKKPPGGKRQWAMVDEYATQLRGAPTIVRTYGDAKQMYALFEAAVLTGAFVAKLPPSRPAPTPEKPAAIAVDGEISLQRLFELYDEQVIIPNGLVRKEIARPITCLINYVGGDTRPDDLRPKHITAYLTDRRKLQKRGGHHTATILKPQSLDKDKASIGGMFTWGVDEGHITRHPFHNDKGTRVIKINTPYRKKEDVLRETDESGLLKAMRCKPPLRRAFLFAILVNVRLGEHRALRVRDVTDKPGWIRIAAVEEGARKGKEPRWLAVVDRRVAAIIRMQTRDKLGDAFLFSSPRGIHKRIGEGTWYRAYCLIARAQGLPVSLTWHSATRATWVTRWLAGGAPVTDCQRQMGHKHVTTTMLYCRPKDEEVGARMQALAATTRRARVAAVLQKPAPEEATDEGPSAIA